MKISSKVVLVLIICFAFLNCGERIDTLLRYNNMSSYDCENPHGYFETIVCDYPISYWRLGETSGLIFHNSVGWEDAVPNTMINSVEGIFGTDKNRAHHIVDLYYITVSSESNYDFDRNNTFSLEIWARTAPTATDRILLRKYNDTSDAGYCLYVSNTNLIGVLFANSASTNYNIETTTVFNDGNWHHIVFTYDGSDSIGGMKLYVDGSYAAVTQISNNLGGSILNDDPFMIGSITSGASNTYHDAVDEVAIYSFPLSSDQIYNHYIVGLSGLE